MVEYFRKYHRKFARVYRVLWQNLYCTYSLPSAKFHQVHRWALAQGFLGYPTVISIVLRPTMAVLWPIKLIWLIFQATSLFGRSIRQQTGILLYQQVLQQFFIGLYYQLPPLEYYRYKLFIKANRQQAANYLQQHEVYPLSVRLNPKKQDNPLQSAVINDKVAFAKFCQQLGLPTPNIFAVVHLQQEMINKEYAPPDCPEVSLFVKPCLGARAEGTSVWLYLGNGLYKNTRNEIILSWHELLSAKQSTTQSPSFLIQPLLTNHSSLASISLNALSVARIVTGLTPELTVIPIVATFKMASNHQQLHSSNGLNSAIDLASGELGLAYYYNPKLPPVAIHPATGAQIMGLHLPQWSQALNLVSLAHNRLQNFTFIGWDIVFTPEGPMLLEGNSGWETVMVQLPQQTPLGLTVFHDICNMWLKANSEN